MSTGVYRRRRHEAYRPRRAPLLSSSDGANFSETVNDGGTEADAVTTALDYARSTADAGTAGDTVTASLDYARTTNDGGTEADTATTVLSLTATVNDGGTEADAVTVVVDHARTTNDAGAASDSPATAVDHAREVNDAGTEADAATAVLSLTATTNDGGTEADDVTVVVDYARTTNDNGTASDAVTVAADYARTVNDGGTEADDDTAVLSNIQVTVNDGGIAEDRAFPHPFHGQDVNATNTGIAGAGVVPGDLTSQGSTTYSTNGEIIKRLDFTGPITVSGDNVTIRECRFRMTGGSAVIALTVTGDNFTIEDCEFIPASGSYYMGVKDEGTTGFTARRLDISKCENNMVIEGSDHVTQHSFLHDSDGTSNPPDPHLDTIEIFAGSQITLDRCRIGDAGLAENGAINISPFFGSVSVDNVDIHDCFIDGGGDHILIDLQSTGTIQYVEVLRCRFGGHTGLGDYLPFGDNDSRGVVQNSVLQSSDPDAVLWPTTTPDRSTWEETQTAPALTPDRDGETVFVTGLGAVAEDSGTAGDTVTVELGHGRTVNDAGTASDADSALLGFKETVNDVGTAGDTITVVAYYARTEGDTGTAGDTVLSAEDYVRVLADAGAAGDTVVPASVFPRSATDSGTASDSVSTSLGDATFDVTVNDSGTVADTGIARLVHSSNAIEGVVTAIEPIRGVVVGGVITVTT